MTDRDDQLADLLMLWDDAKAAGRPLTPQSLCHDTPDLLDPFTDLLQRLGRVDPVLNGTATAAGAEAEVIDTGRFVPLSFHDQGGLGVVHLAEDAELKRVVALKVMKPLPGLDPHARRRFLQEAEITGKLEHPGVAPVYGAGRDPHGRPYYAMRFIHGTTFGDAIERLHALPATDPARPVEFARLLRAFVSVCQTVAYAHARGIIHRDLKPGNIMLGPYGETLVVDWGLAKRVDLPDPHETVDIGYTPVVLHLSPGGGTVYGQVKGSPAYMAP
ncbi:MAG: serine/threonine protein kinase, partial [Gemmataceae bacterium]|nr:serine/threonine protein kinase [Gemmataceae bacterium]